MDSQKLGDLFVNTVYLNTVQCILNVKIFVFYKSIFILLAYILIAYLIQLRKNYYNNNYSEQKMQINLFLNV